MRPPKPGYRGTTFAGGTDPAIRVDPSPATADRNVVRGPAPRNPDDNEQGMRKGGKVKRVTGKPVGKEDGLIAVQKGEYVIKKSSTQKYGPKKMAAVNRGTAKIVTKGSKR